MTLFPTTMLAMIIGLNCVYLLARVDGCEDDPVIHHHVGSHIRVNYVYLLTRIDGCEDDPVTPHHVGHAIRVKLC